MRRALLLAAVVIVANAAGAWAQPTGALTVHSGLLMIVNGVEGGAPNALVPPFGAWVPLRLHWIPPLEWEGGLMMLGLTYRYEGDRGVPVEVEAANSFWVLGLLADLRAVRMWPVRGKLSLGVMGGLALFFRIPAIPYDEAAADWGALAEFLALRSLFPEVGGRLRWQLLERTAIVVDLRALYPLSNLWDTGTPSPLDHLTAGLIAGIEFHL